MSRDTTTSPNPDRGARSSQVWVLLALLGIVILLDQAAKWWGWRHAPGANINAGGDVLVGSTVGGWYSSPVAGALLDVLDAGLLAIAATVLARRRRPTAVLVSGALMLAGWVSNLLDRLGLHYLTAPGSVRGAIDFHHIGHYYYNVADFFIIGATPLFLLSIACSRRLTWSGPAVATTVARIRQRPRMRTWAPTFVAAACLVAAVTVGAAGYGGVNTPDTSTSAAAYP